MNGTIWRFMVTYQTAMSTWVFRIILYHFAVEDCFFHFLSRNHAIGA